MFSERSPSIPVFTYFVQRLLVGESSIDNVQVCYINITMGSRDDRVSTVPRRDEGIVAPRAGGVNEDVLYYSLNVYGNI